jgi:GDPmannose 4,6-dehydratase
MVAKDYVEGMWRILQQSDPQDFVLATGETHPVREFVEKAFAVVGTTVKYVKCSTEAATPVNSQTLLFRWRNTDVQEEGYDAKTVKLSSGSILSTSAPPK